MTVSDGSSRAGGRRGLGRAQRTNRADELHLDARVLQALAILGPYRDLALDRLAIQIQRHLLLAVLVELHIDRLALVEVLEDDVDVDGDAEEVGHGGRGAASALDGVRCRRRRSACDNGRD